MQPPIYRFLQPTKRIHVPKGHASLTNEIKQECLKAYVNGAGLRAIERQKGVHHTTTTIITWVKQVGEKLPDAPPAEVIPEVGELDELETFVSSKKNKIRTLA